MMSTCTNGKHFINTERRCSNCGLAINNARVARFGGYEYQDFPPPRCYVVGAGSRGIGYANMATEDPDLLQVTGVAEPDNHRRTQFAIDHNLTEGYTTTDWRELLLLPKNADFVLVSTLDNDHFEPTIAFLKAGYHVLVEKPMAIEETQCKLMTEVAEENGVQLGVCHVLRYTPYTQKIKSIIDSGSLGKITHVHLLEPVGAQHFAHSYVRGKWRNDKVGSFVLMAKCCHDFDWLTYVLGTPFASFNTVGMQTYFTAENKPPKAGSAKYCYDCPIRDDCPYNAFGNYAELIRQKRRPQNDHETVAYSFPTTAMMGRRKGTVADIEDALLDSDNPYARCVYECDNNQPDVLTTQSQMKDGTMVTIEMVATTAEICQRQVRIHGSKGQIVGDMNTIKLTLFQSDWNNVSTTYEPQSLSRQDTMLSTHWGADWYMLNAFVASIARNDPQIFASGKESLDSHLAVFEAEKSRLEHKTTYLA